MQQPRHSFPVSHLFLKYVRLFFWADLQLWALKNCFLSLPFPNTVRCDEFKFTLGNWFLCSDWNLLLEKLKIMKKKCRIFFSLYNSLDRNKNGVWTAHSLSMFQRQNEFWTVFAQLLSPQFATTKTQFSSKSLVSQICKIVSWADLQLWSLQNCFLSPPSPNTVRCDELIFRLGNWFLCSLIGIFSWRSWK